ncbi:MAG: UDP-3-O-(3-hydroxymyristoyl)glucosamine N-acyltransferase [Bacteroidales bacterium]|nr:UDP-3-O-(3-hydroxymyristoyl)glucosamine N-acyltransferase [Bacteroidales bacterium]MBN2697939.1 UDP-3-O-(3-hydroxymyristoyl)glucosamine N-acyltransferase [Bacteroidales bacterium]
MNFKAHVIAEFLKGTIEGDPEVEVHDVSRIEEGRTGTLSFLSNPKYEKYIYNSKSSIFIVSRDFKPKNKLKATLIRVENAYESFATLLALYEQNKPKKSGISSLSSIDQTASLGENIYVGDFSVISPGASIGNHVMIYPQVYVGDQVTIGDGTILYPGVKIYHNCKIGKNCVLHAGVVIGADGFGFAPDAENNFKKVPQVGSVIIEDEVEIGANTTIDRATIGFTIIRKGVKLDNLIMVAHNVEIGENTVIAGQSGIAGSTKIGKDCLLGGQVGLIGHLKIADGVKIAAQSGLSKDVREEGQVLQGSPAFDFTTYQKCYLLFRKLPELRNQINQLEREIKTLNTKFGK